MLNLIETEGMNATGCLIMNLSQKSMRWGECDTKREFICEKGGPQGPITVANYSSGAAGRRWYFIIGSIVILVLAIVVTILICKEIRRKKESAALVPVPMIAVTTPGKN